MVSNNRITADPNCDDDYDDASLTTDAALGRMLSSVSTVLGHETVAVLDSLGRILASPIVSSIDVPSHRNSAMDGYAVRTQDLPEGDTRDLLVVGTAFAGKPYKGVVAENQAVRIMTGAVVPESTNVVIMQEQVERDGDKITIDDRHKDGQNVRAAGEDIQHGTTVLPLSLIHI